MPVERDKLETVLSVAGDAAYEAAMIRAAYATGHIARAAKESANGVDFGGILRKANQAETVLRPWIARIRKLLLGVVVPFPFKLLVGPVVDLVTWLEKKYAAMRLKVVNTVWPQAPSVPGRTFQRDERGRFMNGESDAATAQVRAAGHAAEGALQRVVRALRAAAVWAARMVVYALKLMAVAAAAAGVALLALWRKAGDEAAALEAVLKDVELQSGATAEEMKGIKQAALSSEMVSLGKSATEAAEGYKRLASEGYGVIEMQQMMGPITRVATVFGLEQAQVTKLMINLMNQYGLEAKDMAYISDVLVGALNNTSLQADEIADALQYAGLAASSMGWSLEETMAVIDPLVATIGNAQMAGVYFREMINSLKNPTDEMREAFAAAGLDIDDFAKNSKSAAQFIGWLNKGTWNAGLVAKAFGNRADAAATILLRQQVPAIIAATKEIWVYGSALKNAEQKMLTVEGRKKQLAAAWKNLLAVIGGRSQGMFANLLGTLTLLIGLIEKYVMAWFNAHQKTGEGFQSSQDVSAKWAEAVVSALARVAQWGIWSAAKIGEALQWLEVRFLNFVKYLSYVIPGLQGIMEAMRRHTEFSWATWAIQRIVEVNTAAQLAIGSLRVLKNEMKAGYQHPEQKTMPDWSPSNDENEKERKRNTQYFEDLAKRYRALNDAVQMVIGGRLSEQVQNQIKRLGSVGDSKGWLQGIRSQGNNRIILELRYDGNLTPGQVQQVQGHIVGLIKQSQTSPGF